MNFKALVKQIDIAAEKWLPLASPAAEEIIAWAALHGWDLSDAECQRLLVRQALLNATIRQTVPSIAHSIFATPLDLLGVKAPESLAATIYEAAQCSQGASFNFWGELYSTLIPQPQRRRIGQFWTDEQIAAWMIAWLLQFAPHRLADVGCGAGSFLLKAAQRLPTPDHAPGALKPMLGIHDRTALYGCDVSPLLLNVTLAAFLTRRTIPLALPTLAAQNYLDASLPTDVDAVVCNPPYTRHHHIDPARKDALQAYFKTRFHLDVSRQATLAFYFLLRIVAEMPAGACAAVIMPMEVLDARYGKTARQILCQHTALSAIVHFAPQMNAFHKVDVGASILFFRKGHEKQNSVRHLTLTALPTTDEFLACLDIEQIGKHGLAFGSLLVQPQDDLLETPKWFSIATPQPANAEWQSSGLVVPLKALAKIVRGIATGANEFFVLPTEQVKQRLLDPYVVRTLQRNREVQDIVLDEARWQALSDEGKCVWLLYLNGHAVSEHTPLGAYLAEGVAKGYHQRSLVQTRKKWYAMEQRDIPAIFFTILTRGNPRFILNRAGVRPLNMFSLLYPNRYIIEADATEMLWALLNCNFSLSRLLSVSRTYGGNTLKVEPRELDNLPVINPLALSDADRHRIKGWIDDFYHHQQASILMCQANGLIDALLIKETSGENRSSLPIQPRLLEIGRDY